MKIKEIYIEQYGPYEKWRFQAHEAGLHVLYGPMEAVKQRYFKPFAAFCWERNVKKNQWKVIL